jgi:CheY-like chemotaxis protein
VTSVGNGRLALDALEKGSFDLVLSDQQMPMMTGIQLCENLRQLPAQCLTHLINVVAEEIAVRPGKINVLEDAFGVAHRRKRLQRFHTVGAEGDDFARLHFAHILCFDQIEQ